MPLSYLIGYGLLIFAAGIVVGVGGTIAALRWVIDDNHVMVRSPGKDQRLVQ